MSTQIEIEGEEEYRLPCHEALLAGTLALMTGHAQAGCDGTRQAMNTKIVDNLSQLAGHPVVSPLFRAALRSLLAHWEVMQRHGETACAASDLRFWHASPPSIQ